jgi:hypothetical protein
MDTFGWATLQLREMGLRIQVEPNHRAQREAMGAWMEAPWFHVGGLSAGHGLYLLGNDDKTAQRDAVRQDPYDWQKRMSWWQRVAEKWDGALPEHHAAYLRELGEYMTVMVPSEVTAWRQAFDGLISWAE